MCLSCALLLLLVCCLGGSAAPEGREVSVGDAFARGSEDGLRWSVGTAAVRMAFDCRDGRLQLAELQNTLTDTPCDYAEPGALSPPLALDAAPLAGTFVTEALWSGHVAPGATADPGTQRLQVRAGDLLGFCATTRADDGGAGLDWPTTVAYKGGEAFRSAEDAELAQGPVWYTYVQATGTGCLEQLGETVEIAPGVKARVPEVPACPRATALRGSAPSSAARASSCSMRLHSSACGRPRMMGSCCSPGRPPTWEAAARWG